jgi:Flp pilus assembly protein TadD/predicted  nucleic acid-binding Zn-ribbon protein
MRRFFISLTLILVAVAAPQRAFSQADTSELFLNAYMANEQGQKLENSGDTQKALSKYRYAASLLDQITHDDPNWQPVIVDYRKKRISENIARLQQVLGAQPTPSESTPAEGELPQKETGGPPERPPATTTGGGNQQLREQLDQLQADLRESREKLRRVEGEKADLFNRLSDTVKQLDRTKEAQVELKSDLKQAQDAYQNAVADHSQTAGSQKELQARIFQLQNALRDAEADRDAADEQNGEYARRAAKQHQAASAVAQQRDAANAHIKDIESKYSDASKLASKLDAAQKQIAALTKDRDAATQRADDLDEKVASASKTAAKLADAQKQIAALKAGQKETAEKNSDVAGKLADARKQIDQLTSDRDSARKQVTALNGKLADASKEIVAVKSDRDKIATQRDQALADLGKAREAQKHVDELMATNASLMQKVAADEKTIKNFNAGSPEKDKEIADLRKQVGDTKTLLASAQQDRDNVQSSMSDLQQQYDSTSAELTELKANNGVNAAEKKAMTEENDLLRGIVLRELKEQAHRNEAKKLVMSELSQLQVQSDTLLKRIDYLGQPVVKLTDKEKALFKDPSLDIPDADETAMSFSFAAPKQAAHSASPAGLPPALPPPATNTAAAESAPMPTAQPFPSASPMELASRTTPGADFPPLPETSPAGEKTATSSVTPPAGMSGMVPVDMMEDAHAAKEAFDRAKYPEAEKRYVKMLAKAPNNVYILSNLGVVYFRNQKWNLAEESLKKAIAVAPEDVFSWCTLGIVYYQEGQHDKARYDDAIDALTKAIAINPKYAVAHNYLGIAASQKGWQEAALKELETAIDIDPNYADACFNLAVVYAMEQPPNKDMARKYYRRAIDLGAEPDAALEQLLK